MPRIPRRRKPIITRFREKTRPLIEWLMDWLEREQPATDRMVFYQAVVAGHVENAKPEYQKIVNLLTKLRDSGDLPLSWIADHGRRREQSSCWKNVPDFADAVSRAYRLDFWAHLPKHVCLLVEKDTIHGVIGETCDELHIPCWVSRGYCSLSFCNVIAEEWGSLDQPIQVYFVGDFDPSGMNIEESYQRRLKKYSGLTLAWTRLAITEDDLERDDVVKIPVKPKDPRTPAYRKRFGDYGTEVESLAPHELRLRIREAVEQHFTPGEWHKLERREEREQSRIARWVKTLK